MNYVEKSIDELLSKMTLAEKIGQLNQISSPLDFDDEIFEKVKEGNIGSFIMATTAHAGNDETESVGAKLLNELQRIAVEESRLGIPLIFGRDVIHGHNTVLPIPLGTAASFNGQLVKKCYRDVASEAARDGVHWTFSPMLDLSRDPRWGRCVEGPGEDPFLGSTMAKAIVNGFQGEDLSCEDSIAACAKHFIGYGASEGGRDYHRTEISDYSLRNYYLPAFKAAVDSGVQTVMSGFNEVSGQPISSSRYLLSEVLKKELGFDGFIISDWSAIPQIKNQGVAEDDKQAAELCFNAGLDMDMVDECYFNHLSELIDEGKVDLKQLDDSVRRILRVKFRLGLFDNPYIPQYKVDFETHKRNARKLAAESIVLLKNEKNILPLSQRANITLMGEYANDKNNMLGTWCLDGMAENVTSVYEGIQNNFPKCKVDCRFTSLANENISGIGGNDYTVVCIGESKMKTGEAISVADIKVEDRYINLLKSARKQGKPIIAVMFYGRPTALEEIEPYCDAILWCWHPGTEAGNAVADILFGNENPSGKLPMTLPRATGQIPIYYNFSPASRDVNGYYGYKYYGVNYIDCIPTPMYRFGFGLSYSKFKLSDIKSDKNEIALNNIKNGEQFKISLNIKNVSDISGAEVIQLYIRDKVASMSRPIRELKGYNKVFLNPNEEKTVEFNVGFNELAFYNGKGEFVVEAGDFDIFIGNDCYADRAFTLKVI